MLLFPNAKINLGLNVIAKRPDGYHDIETCFLPLNLFDILEFVECKGNTAFTLSGNPIPESTSENLCIKAWKLLSADFKIEPVRIHLHKNIPIGAGLGGGSSDAAFMLKGLNSYFHLNLTHAELEAYASQLGSDCAFFIRNTPAFAQSRGEILSTLNIDLKDYKIALINPGIHISTSEAYSMVIPRKPEINLIDCIKKPINTWQNIISNDFERGVFQKHPEIAEIKKSLITQGAVYASMSGSGSSVYGVFAGTVPQEIRTYFKTMFIWIEE